MLPRNAAHSLLYSGTSSWPCQTRASERCNLLSNSAKGRRQFPQTESSGARGAGAASALHPSLPGWKASSFPPYIPLMPTAKSVREPGKLLRMSQLPLEGPSRRHLLPGAKALRTFMLLKATSLVCLQIVF